MRASSAGSASETTAFRVVDGVERSAGITIYFEGKPLPAFPGETLAAALLANGVRTFRIDKQGRPRAPWCNMGVCFECALRCRRGHEGLSGVWQSVRACLTAVAPGMEAAPLLSHARSADGG